MIIETDLTPFEQAVLKNLLSAQATLHSQVDRLVKFDCLSKIISYCRQLKCDPVPYLKDPKVINAPQEVKSINDESVLKCPHCAFTTDKGIMSIKAHIGRKHKANV